MALVLALVLLLALLVAIFLLARQNIRQTGDTALRVERWLLSVVPPTGTGSIGEPTWAGLTIRQLAHVAEFAALGTASAVTCALVLGPGIGSTAAACGICLLASVADETHKRFVPGRHFDAQDLLLDAYGYLPTVILLTLLTLALGG